MAMLRKGRVQQRWSARGWSRLKGDEQGDGVATELVEEDNQMDVTLGGDKVAIFFSSTRFRRG